MNRLVIFGTGDIAQLAQYYFDNDSDYEVAAFSVDGAYLTENRFCGRPVIAFEELSLRYPPDSYDLFIALSYSKLNAIRKAKYEAAQKMGYHLASYVSSRASVLNDGDIGDNCFILEDNTIQPFVTIGSNVTLWSGNHIGHHAIIHDHCFLASHIVVSGGVEIMASCFIGVNATLRDHIRVGEKCVIGAGALIMADTEPGSVYKGVATKSMNIGSDRLKKI